MNFNPKIIFGSMRMLEYTYDENYWIDLFDYMYDKGIIIHHISAEYSSFEFYLKILKLFEKKFPFKKIKHLIKLAEPHFDSNSFNSASFYSKLNTYLNSIGSNHIWGVQWMWRGDMNFEEKRIVNYNSDFSLLSEIVISCKKKGLIERFFIFPYTDSFCIASQKLNSELSASIFDGLTIYRNLIEKEHDIFLNYFSNNIIIRPLYAGKLDGNISKKEAFDFSVNHPNIDYGIVSISSKAKLNELLNDI
jgi:hypothetical protein